MIVIGMISGTSVDAIDVAVARFAQEGGRLTLTKLGHGERAWPEATRRRLLAALPPAQVAMGEVCALDVLVGEAFGAVARDANREFAGGAAALIGSHGQNVFHWVEDGRARGTLQLGQPAVIAEMTGLPVVSDLRARDVAAGGQGAPLASTLDALWLAGPGGTRAALNLGGIANITVVGERGVRERGVGATVVAYDTGPANCLLDIEASRLSGGAQSCDVDGRMARSGRVRDDLLSRLLAEPYYALPPPKSTGRERFDEGYVQRCMAGLGAVSGPDLMATLTELTARTVAQECARHHVTEVVVSGGGARNPALLEALGRALGPIKLTDAGARGMPADGKEAYLFALLGYLAWHGLPGTVPGATGARAARILGRVSPGNGPLRLATTAEVPTTLVID